MSMCLRSVVTFVKVLKPSAITDADWHRLDEASMLWNMSHDGNIWTDIYAMQAFAACRQDTSSRLLVT